MFQASQALKQSSVFCGIFVWHASPETLFLTLNPMEPTLLTLLTLKSCDTLFTVVQFFVCILLLPNELQMAAASGAGSPGQAAP